MKHAFSVLEIGKDISSHMRWSVGARGLKCKCFFRHGALHVLGFGRAFVTNGILEVQVQAAADA